MHQNIKYTIYFLLGIILFYFMFNKHYDKDLIEGIDHDEQISVDDIVRNLRIKLIEIQSIIRYVKNKAIIYFFEFF